MSKLRWIERKESVPYEQSGYSLSHVIRVLQVWDEDKFNGDWQEYGGWVDVPLEVED